MFWIDGHCDVLYKMWKSGGNLSFYAPDSSLDVTFSSAQRSRLLMQVFAIWVPEEVSRHLAWHVALRQVDLFYERIVQDSTRTFVITESSHLDQLREGKLGAFLLLEGADALQGEIAYLRTLYRLGVRQVGLTWNHANEAADGIEEPRGGGLTRFGQQLIKEMARLGMIVDVSHLSVRGFWDVMEYTDVPVVASHSNCYAVCPHPRNLGDDQIRALIERGGLIGITFVPKFVHQQGKEARWDHLFRHIDHICHLGGAGSIAFGSDFDGTEEKIPGLAHAGDFADFAEKLMKRYPEEWVRKWTGENWLTFYRTYLRN
ncbi:dipeptidase [Polycladomyces subterraneus]|uniref:Dipeptidase n=1 Tax=Polycladomyces subterraneus TaxID=1016997 RepID=A0ABT8IQL6_9BACL|nr:dipeptidase [Polycladomyces subterraneus]MDN4594404.1 dipeptidase [Polycladomyces subterraneus]